tara:strand:+ start:473 stop:760 length:288 start_codon:yes stop_codon:yes gene_type:complete
MSDKKRRIIRLIESYINDFQGKSVQEMYGKNSRIKIHDINYSTNTNSLLLEAVIVLGDVINEEVMDRKLADILIQDALIYFYPETSIKTYVRFDV